MVPQASDLAAWIRDPWLGSRIMHALMLLVLCVEAMLVLVAADKIIASWR
jgi:hypothetical protein